MIDPTQFIFLCLETNFAFI